MQVQYRGRRRSGTAATRAEAVELHHELERELRGVMSDKRPTVGQLVERRIATAEWAPKSLDAYSRAQRRLSWLANIRADRLTVVDVERRYDELTASGLDADSVRQLHSLLSQAMNEGIRVQAISSSPMAVCRIPKKPKPQLRIPSPDEVAVILEHAGEYEPILRLMATTGMRRGEAVGLRWDRLDLRAAGDQLRVEMSLAYDKSVGVHERPTKTGEAGHRTITIGPTLVTRLRALRQEQREVAIAIGTQPGPWVFSDDGGTTPWRLDRITRIFAAARKRAATALDDDEVKQVRLHDLRHFAATQMLSAGINARIVAYRLGHTDEATTRRIYDHHIPGEDGAAAALMDQIVG